MTKKQLVVFGASGNQGGSVAHTVLDDPELSKQYSVRAVARSTSSPSMQELQSKGAEVVAADLNKPETLKSALSGAHTIFAVTFTDYGGNTRESETRQAKALLDEAEAQAVQYVIWSSMSHPYKISNGKLKHAEHFDVKAEIEQLIRARPFKSAFFAPAGFMQNFITPNMAPRPSPANDGSYVVANLASSDTRIPLIDITDTGKWIAPILADPEKYDGKFFAAADGLYSYTEIVETLSKVSGKKVTHQQLPDEVFKSYLPEPVREQLFEMYLLMRDYGYYGANMEGDIDWAQKQANGRLTTFEEFLRKVNFKLE